MTDLEILARLFLAIGFGAILGLETETRTSQEADPKTHNITDVMQQRLGGVRTYTVISLFGALSGLMFSMGYQIFAYLAFTAVFFIVLAAYVLNIQYRKAFGMTTEIAILITVLIGFAATSGLISLEILIVLIILLAFILSQKRGIAILVAKIQHDELIDIIKFTILALVVLPFLPNVDIYVKDLSGVATLLSSLGVSTHVMNQLVLFNPFRLWQYVVLLSGFNLAGYFANKLWGKKSGIMVTGVFGGLISSTVTTVSFALASKKEGQPAIQKRLGAASLLANAVSFIPLIVLALSASSLFFASTVGISVTLSVGSIVVALLYIFTIKDGEPDQVDVKYEPFSLFPALKFAVLLTVIKLVLQIAELAFGGGAFVVLTALSGFVGMDVATISLGELVAAGSLGVGMAAFTYVISNVVNFAAKSIYALRFGTHTFAKVVAVGMMVAGLAAIGMLFLVK